MHRNMAEMIKIEGKCPYCNHEITVERLEVIDASRDTEIKEALISGKYFMETCEACNERFNAATPTVYYDPTHHAMIEFDPEYEENKPLLSDELYEALKTDEDSQPKRFTRRVVKDPNLFIEKIHLLEAGLDDRVVELTKAISLQGNAAALWPIDNLHTVLYVPARDGGNPQIVFLYGDRQDMPTVDFSRDMYDTTGSFYFDRLEAQPDQPVIDLAWALDFLKMGIIPR